MIYAPVGELPLPVLRLLSRLGSTSIRLLKDAGPGFTLPVNIGNLGSDITELNLARWSLTGNFLRVL